MQRTMSSEELSSYIEKIKNPSECFKLFIHDYVSSDSWDRSREGVDTTVWNRLSGDELEAAKMIILDGLTNVIDPSYIRAVGIFRDVRAIPILKNIINNYPDRYIAEKMLAAYVLFNWIGYKDYVSFLESVCQRRDELTYNYFKYHIDDYIEGLEKSEISRIMKALSE